MHQSISLHKVIKLLQSRSPTDNRVLSRENIATLAVRRMYPGFLERMIPGKRAPIVFDIATTSDEQFQPIVGSAEIAKIGYFQVVSGVECILVKHTAGFDRELADTVARLSHAVMGGTPGDVFLTGVVNPACNDVTLFYSSDGGKNWKSHAAREMIQDFHVGKQGEVAVISGIYANFVDAPDILRHIVMKTFVLQDGVVVEPGDILTRILANEKERCRLAVYSPTLGKTRVYDYLRQLDYEADTPNFILSALNANGFLIEVAAESPSGSVRRVTTSDDTVTERFRKKLG